MNDRKRITPLKFVAWFTLVLGAIYVFSVPYFLYLTTTLEILNDSDAADEVKGLRIAALACAVLALPAVLGGWKLLKRKTWAYWLVTANLAICVAGLAMGTFEDWRVDQEVLVVFLVFLTVFIVALLPTTRRELKQAV
jgi:hypothetical protein